MWSGGRALVDGDDLLMSAASTRKIELRRNGSNCFGRASRGRGARLPAREAVSSGRTLEPKPIYLTAIQRAASWIEITKKFLPNYDRAELLINCRTRRDSAVIRVIDQGSESLQPDLTYFELFVQAVPVERAISGSASASHSSKCWWRCTRR